MKLRILTCLDPAGQATDEISYWMWCPGCNDSVRINNTWTFNGNEEKPTFSPSILTKHRHPKGHTNDNPAPAGYDGEFVEDVCHSFLVDGMWQLLDDCTHALAGQTVPMVRTYIHYTPTL